MAMPSNRERFLPSLGRTAAPVLLAMCLLAAAGAAPSSPAPQKDEATHKRIAQLIEQMGDKDYFVRERAQAELMKIGFAAHEALTEAATNDDLEIAARARYVLRQIRIEWTLADDSEEVKEILKDYEFQNPDERQSRIASLAELPDGAGIGALCRLVRFEQSEDLSKWAAIAVLLQDDVEDPLRDEWRRTIRKMLAECRRTGARWLLAYLQLREKPASAIDEWARLAAAEQATLRRDPRASNPTIVATLWRIQVTALEQLNRIDAAAEVIQRLLTLTEASGQGDKLREMMAWAIDKKAWRLVDDVAARYPTRIAGNSALLYLMAEACLARGDAKQAEEHIRKARLRYTEDPNSLGPHVFAASMLFRRGKYDWAEREFRDVIEHGLAGSNDKDQERKNAVPPPMRRKGKSKAEISIGTSLAVTAHILLAEMFHDQAQSLRAAETLKSLDERLLQGKKNDERVGDRSAGEIRARMHYFYACHHREKGQLDPQRKELDLALEADPAEIDVLIACYRLNDVTPEYRRKIVERIRKVVEDTQEEIAASPSIATPYNQVAWLVGNTEGDFDQALKWSRTSISLGGDKGSYYDTLARVYYAKGDIDNAVHYQTKAARLEPHFGLIARQLKFFKDEQAKRQKSAAAPKS